VETAGAALPEFDSLGNQQIAAPEGREGDFLVVELLFDFEPAGFERGAIKEGRVLIGGPGGDAAAAGTGLEILVGFFPG